MLPKSAPAMADRGVDDLAENGLELVVADDEPAQALKPGHRVEVGAQALFVEFALRDIGRGAEPFDDRPGSIGNPDSHDEIHSLRAVHPKNAMLELEHAPVPYSLVDPRLDMGVIVRRNVGLEPVAAWLQGVRRRPCRYRSSLQSAFMQKTTSCVARVKRRQRSSL